MREARELAKGEDARTCRNAEEHKKGSLTFQQMQATSNCKNTLLQASLLFSGCSSSSVDETTMHAGLVTHIHPSAFIDHSISHLLRIFQCTTLPPNKIKNARSAHHESQDQQLSSSWLISNQTDEAHR